MFATVLGLPITTVVSQYFGWRISFGAVSVLVLVSGIMIQWLLPSSSNKEQLNWKTNFCDLRIFIFGQRT